MAFNQVNLTACNMIATDAVEDRAPSLLPADEKWKLVWNDEFDGERLDDSKWGYRTNFWGRKAHWFATPEDNAVEVKDGSITFENVSFRYSAAAKYTVKFTHTGRKTDLIVTVNL